MTHPEPPDSNPPSGPRGPKGRRRVVSLDAGDSLVTTSTLSEHSSLPLIVQPALPGVDLAAWAETNSAQFETWLVHHGSVLLRGFGLVTPVEFETVVSALVPDLFADYGDLPKEESGQKIYHSTPYPHDMAILFHNESSHLPSWPTRQFFFCVQPSLVGGNTPLLDCELVMRKINPELLQRFTTKKLCYVRNFVPGVDVSWQDFFKTDDREHTFSATPTRRSR